MKRLLICLLLAGCVQDKTPDPVQPPVVIPDPLPSPPPPPHISQDGITLVADPGWAGAITSLTYNGMETVNVDDHGREIQSAMSFDDWGECFNPTEAGRFGDASGSSSILQSIDTTNNVLATSTDAAFWLAPGFDYGHQCGTHIPIETVAQNKTATAGYLIQKVVRFDAPHSLRFNLTYVVPEFHESGTFEFTGYLLSDYNFFYTFDPKTGELADLAAGEWHDTGEQPLPVILSNRLVSMGVYAPPDGLGGPGFGRWQFFTSKTNKWNVVWRERKIQPGTKIRRTAWVCIGNMQDVKDCLTTAYGTSSQTQTTVSP